MAFIARLIWRSMNFRPYSPTAVSNQVIRIPPPSREINISQQHCGVSSLLPPQIQREIQRSWSKSPFELHSVVACRLLASQSSSGGCKPPSNDEKPAKEEKLKSKSASHESGKGDKSKCKSTSHEANKEDKPKCKSTSHEPAKADKPKSVSSSHEPDKKDKPKDESTSPGPVKEATHAPGSEKGHQGDDQLPKSERQVLQNFHKECIKKINTQINHELKAAYNYIEMASFCGQDNVALFGFAKFFTNAYKEEIEHAETLIDYLNKRGGELQLASIPVDAKGKWNSAEELVSTALALEKDINKELLNLHACASEHGDPHLTNFLEEHYLNEQVDAIKTLADLLTRVKRVKGCCIHTVDKELLKGVISSHGNGK